MIELYAWGTTNGRRPIVMLEEAALPYNLHPTDIRAGDHKTEAYAKVSPFRKIPAMIDTDGPDGKPITMFESTAILHYLATKSGKFLGSDDRTRAEVNKWLLFCASNVMPLFNFFREKPDELAKFAENPLDVLNGQLSNTDYLAGEYSIADMALVTRLNQFADNPLVTSRPALKAWLERVKARPAVEKALTMPIAK